MKILANIPGAFKLVRCLKYFKPYGKEIDAARAAGDAERNVSIFLNPPPSGVARLWKCSGAA